MADYRPVAPNKNLSNVPVAPTGRVNTGNNYLVNQARKNLSSTNQPATTPAGLVVNSGRSANNMNKLPTPLPTVAGAAQERALAGANTQQADMTMQSRNNMGTGTGMGLLQRAQVQGRVR